MCKLISDFIKSSDTGFGFGHFEGDHTAIRFAQSMSKSQKRQYRRYGVIPTSFIGYLKIMRVIPFEAHLPKTGHDIHSLLELLWEGPYENKTARSAGSYLRSEILKDMYPMLKKSFGTAENIWQRIKRDKITGRKYLPKT